MSRDGIVDEALRLVAVHGPEQLTMRRLAAGLGLTARALYGYFQSKNDLEAALVERVMPPPPPVITGTAWNDQLRDYVLAIRDAFVEQPGAARLFALQSATGPAMDHAREHLLRLLVAGGLGDEDAIAALGTLSRYLMGCVIVEGERGQQRGSTDDDRFHALPVDEFPTLTRLASQYADRDSDESTRYGLDLILAALVATARR